MANEEVFYSALHWAKKAEASAKLASELAQSGGKLIQLGFDGVMEDGVLVFKHAPGGIDTPYQLVDDVEYEIDLAYNETGDLPNLTEIAVQNGGETIRFISALHRDAMTNATVADMDTVMRYNSSTGYRWLFKAAYKITPSGAKVFLLYPVVAAKDYSDKTNCITEIPQDIKLELVDGVLTLKAGSKVYVPNGFEADDVTPKFDVVVIESDMIAGKTTQKTEMLFYRDSQHLDWKDVSRCSSGESDPQTTGTAYYDVQANKLHCHSSSGVKTQNSLPLCIFKGDGSGVASVDQVFNGFGYIGSTVFALPNVKGLIPNGRNADGSLRNKEFTVQQVLTHTSTISLTYERIPFIIQKGNVIGYNGLYKYDNIDNVIYDGEQIREQFVCGYVKLTNSVISNFTPKLPFRAVDRNDSSWIAGQAMPSNKYINLTLGASGSNYTAPANGYVITRSDSTGTFSFLHIYNPKTVFGTTSVYTSGAGGLLQFLPVKKGDIFRLEYDQRTFSVFRFIYAEGEK